MLGFIHIIVKYRGGQLRGYQANFFNKYSMLDLKIDFRQKVRVISIE